MYKFMQKNKKKMLAIFGVLLMIVFILPTTAKRYRPHDESAFHLGKETVSVGEVREAEQEWQEIERVLFPELGPVQLVVGEMHDKPSMFVLLQREAKQLGLSVSDAQVDEALTRLAQQYARAGRQMPPGAGTLKPAMRSLLLVRALFDRVADGVKPSPPYALREMAENGQRVKIDLVHYAADDFKKQAATPTPEQLQKQFDEFKSLPSGSPDERNPFGFGYLTPAKVRLLYITVPHDEAVQAVRKSKEQIDWETLAVLHYRQNLSKYPATQKSESRPSTTSTATTTKTASTSKPASTTKPFAEVKEQVISEVMQADVDKKIDEVAGAVHERLTGDFEARQKHTANAPEDFATRQYYDHVAADIEKKTGVRIGVSEINDPKDETGLRGIKGIGQSFSGDTVFADYVMRWAEPMVPATLRTNSQVLSLDKPSPRFRDLDGNVYVFQIREATPAAPPEKLADVKSRVESDVRTKLEFDAAVAAAKKLRESAEKIGLAAAAKAANKDVFRAPDFFDRRGMTSSFDTVTLIPAVTLSDTARQHLVAHAFELLGKATPDKPHPAGISELPDAGRVVVAELADVERPWKDDQQDLLQYQFAQQLAMQRAQRLLAEYFKFDAVKQRLDYRNPREKAS